MAYKKSNANGQGTMANSEPVTIASDQSAVPVSSATFATSAKQDTLLAELQLKADLTETQPVSAASLPLPAGAATSALQTQPGVDIGDVTINNAAGASAVNIQDGGNSITVDAPVGTPAFVRLSDGAAAITTLPVSLASVPSHAVTNAGTFLVQNNAATPAGTNNIGDVDVLTLPALPTGANVIGALTANQSVNVAQMNGVATTMGNGVAGTGVQRVAIASDNTAFTVNAAQSGTWTVQPGNTQNTTEWLVIDKATTTGGLSKAHLVSAATTNATNVKASAGQVYAITAFNLNASPRYLKLHNTAGTPTAGTSVTDTFLIPGNTSGAGLVINFDKGIAFSTGIGFTLVTGIADANAVAVAADEITLQIYFK